MKIAIVRLSALGDIIQSQATLQFIKKKYPDSEIHWFCDSAFEDILKENKLIDKVIPLEIKDLKRKFRFSKLFSIINTLKEYGFYDYIIDLQGLIKSSIVGRILGTKTYGFDKSSIREEFASNFYKHKFKIPYSENVIRRYSRLVNESLNLKITDKDLANKEKILYYREEADVSKYFSTEKKNVVFILGASWDSKIYPAKKMANIANELDVNPIVVWGNDSEEKLANEFISNCVKGKKCDKLSLNALIALIDKSDLVIGPDTGPTHIAWAQNIPVITIFGATPSFRNTFTTPISRVIDTGKKIDPLNLNKDNFDITSIPEHKVIKVAKELLGR